MTGIFADAVRSKLIVFEDADKTASNIGSSEWLFRIGFISDIFSSILFLMAAWALYILLKPVNKNIALLFLLLNLGGVAVQSVNMINLFSATLILGGVEYLKVFQPGQPEALSLLFLNLHKNGFMIAQFFYAAWLFPLGYLVYKSGFLPKFLGILLMVECFGWLIRSLQFFLFPDFKTLSYLSFAIGFIGEFTLTLWLLVKGVKGQNSTMDPDSV